MRKLLLISLVVLLGCKPDPSSTQSGATPNAKIAFQQARDALFAKWIQCADNTGTRSIFTKVVPRNTQNPFAPVLTPPGTGKEFGYYNFSTPLDAETDQVRLTTADRQNGLRERYVIHWFTRSYRTWESTTREWSEWKTGTAWEKDKINFLNSTVTLMSDGSWQVREAYNIFTGGTFVKPKCGEIPQ